MSESRDDKLNRLAAEIKAARQKTEEGHQAVSRTIKELRDTLAHFEAVYAALTEPEEEEEE